MKSICTKTLIVSALVAATSASVASAQRDLNQDFMIDLVGISAVDSQFNAIAVTDTNVMIISTQSADAPAIGFLVIIAEQGAQAPNFGSTNTGSSGSFAASQGFGNPSFADSESPAIVPLPTAALAGLSMLMGIGGIRFARNRK